MQIDTCMPMFIAVLSESEVAQSCPTLCNPMDCSPQAPLSMGFSRQEYWSGLPFPSPAIDALVTINYYSIIQSSFTTLKTVSHLLIPPVPALGNL